MLEIKRNKLYNGYFDIRCYEIQHAVNNKLNLKLILTTTDETKIISNKDIKKSLFTLIGKNKKTNPKPYQLNFSEKKFNLKAGYRYTLYSYKWNN